MPVKIVIISVPYTEPLPMVAPVLLSACLNNNGISAKGIDFSIQFLSEFINKPYWPSLKNLISIGIRPPEPMPRRAIIDVLKFIKTKLLAIKNEYDPEYLGLSIFTNESINFSYLLIPYIRKYLPNTKIMLGGRGLELICGVENRIHAEKYYDHGMADVVVVGDSETAIVEVIQNNITGIYNAKLQTREDLERIPIPLWDDYDFSFYKNFENYQIPDGHDTPGEDPRYLSVTGSKGCVRHCTFCDVASFWPKYIYRDGESIANEIIFNYKKTGIENYRFTDNLMNGSISHYKKMNVVLAKEIPNTIHYQGYAIFRSKSQMPEEDFELASRAGCRLWSVGIESGSERVRYELKKKFSNEDLHHGVINLHKNNIKQNLLFMVGYPTETDWDFKETLNIVKKYAYLNKNGMIRIMVTQPFMLLHNSPLIQSPELYDQYKLNYDIKDNLSRWFWVSDVNPENDFNKRYDRWIEMIQTITNEGYVFPPGNPIETWHNEIVNIKKIYDETKPKKVFALRSV